MARTNEIGMRTEFECQHKSEKHDSRPLRARAAGACVEQTGGPCNAELVRGDLGNAVQKLKQESGKGLFVGGVKLALALTELGLIDEYEFVVHPRPAGHRPTLFARHSLVRFEVWDDKNKGA
jgi:dihydrofolate reductase